jgi:hypothetical protein
MPAPPPIVASIVTVGGNKHLQLDSDPNVDSFGFIVSMCTVEMDYAVDPAFPQNITHFYNPNSASHPNVIWFSQSRVAIDITFASTEISCWTITGTTQGGGNDGERCPPDAFPASYQTAFETPINITLVATPGWDADALEYAIIGFPTHGTLTGDAVAGHAASPDVTYTPDDGWAGQDSFTFQVEDMVLSESSNVPLVQVETLDAPPHCIAITRTP